MYLTQSFILHIMRLLYDWKSVVSLHLVITSALGHQLVDCFLCFMVDLYGRACLTCIFALETLRGTAAPSVLMDCISCLATGRLAFRFALALLHSAFALRHFAFRSA